jgi:hypothetical protein
VRALSASAGLRGADAYGERMSANRSASGRTTVTLGAKRLRDPVRCWACPTAAGNLMSGWALRADGQVASCPDHLEHMPPHPQADEHATVAPTLGLPER